MFRISSLLARKLRSAITLLKHRVLTFFCYAQSFLNPSLTIGKNCHFGKSIKLQGTDGGTISIGKNTSLSDGVQIIARGGNIDIGENVFIGIGAIMVCQSNVTIGDNALIAEYVVLRDQDHRFGSKPNQNPGYIIAPILIGKNVWLGTKVSVLRGSNIEDNVVIGAHSLVRGNIPSYSLAVGCPAKVVKKYPEP